MQGHLYIENEESTLMSKYVPRYFVLFPFCGLRWFLSEPEETDIEKLLTSSLPGGWLFGGNIRVVSINVESPCVERLSVDTQIFPFRLELSPSFDKLLSVRLACDDIDLFHSWIDEIRRSIRIQNYLVACIECGATPSRTIFCTTLDSPGTIILENINLTIPSLGSLIMMCKLNDPQGSLLRVIHLENAQISDLHVPLLSSFLSFTPHLESLSLAHNYLTDAGITTLSEQIKSLFNLLMIDLSSNYISDAGVMALCEALKPQLRPSKLNHLDLSRNRLTEQSSRYLVMAIAGYGNSITFLNLSYNAIGDTSASLVAILMCNDDSKIQNVNISFCGIGNQGIAELADAVINCSTLRCLNVRGNYMDSRSLTKLMQALSDHQFKYGTSLPKSITRKLGNKNKALEAISGTQSDLSLHIGGLIVEDEFPKALSQKTYRTSIAYASVSSSVEFAMIRRRVVTSMQSIALNASNVNGRSNNIRVVCMRVQILNQYDGIQDVLATLARILKADERQLQIISCSEPDEANCCFFIFTPLDPSPLEIQSCSYRRKQLITKSEVLKGPKKISRVNLDPAKLLPSADSILMVLTELAKVSSPFLRKLGIRTVYIQHSGGGLAGAKSASFHCHIRGSGSGGGGIAREYIPPLFPMASMVENDDIGKDHFDEEELAAITAASTRIQSSSFMAREKLGLLDGDDIEFFHDDEDEDKDDESEHDDVKQRRNEVPFLKSDSRNAESGPSDAIAHVSEELDSDEKKDAKLITSICKMAKEGEIGVSESLFWRGMFGDADSECFDMVRKVQEYVFDEDHLFQYLGIRKSLLDAMFRREVSEIGDYIEHIHLHKISGGNSIAFAEKLHNELSIIAQDSLTLESLAQGPQDAYIVEQFLLSCARSGYAGNETLMAVELREYLVRWAIEEDSSFLQDGMDGVKQRALITNLMISRDLVALKDALDSIMDSGKVYLPASQQNDANRLLTDCATAKQNLEKALRSQSIHQIEDALAYASYLNYYDEVVQESVDVMLELGSDVISMSNALVESMRGNSLSYFDAAFAETQRVGWIHSCLHKDVVTKIFEERKRIIVVSLLF